jgi:hypothetical protein
MEPSIDINTNRLAGELLDIARLVDGFKQW